MRRRCRVKRWECALAQRIQRSVEHVQVLLLRVHRVRELASAQEAAEATVGFLRGPQSARDLHAVDLLPFVRRGF